MTLIAPRIVLAQDTLAVVLTEQAQMRDAPSITAVVRAILVRDDTVKVKRREGYWLVVAFATREGFIRMAQLSDPYTLEGSAKTPRPVELSEPEQVITPLVVAASPVVSKKSPAVPQKTAARSTKSDSVSKGRAVVTNRAPASSETPPADSQRVAYLPPAFGNPSLRVPVMVAPVLPPSSDERLDSVPPIVRRRFAMEVGYVRSNLSIDEAFGTTDDASSQGEQRRARGESGSGMDIQLRAWFRMLSLGLGYTSTLHQRDQTGDRESWPGPFIEPRVEWSVTRRAALSLGVRAGLLAGAAKGDSTLDGSPATSQFITRSRQFTGIIGVRHYLRDRIALDLQGGIGTLPISTLQTRTVVESGSVRTERRTTRRIDRSGGLTILRAGLSLGF